jgi:hypothetical protein
MVYENVKKIYGPYSQKSGRLMLILTFYDEKRKTISYPKYLMEVYLDRYLLQNETVDHIDGDFLNNDLSNLQVLDRKIHAENDVLRNYDISVNCTYCNASFTIEGSKVHYRNNRCEKQSGYFCSKSCSGKYGAEIQNGRIQPIKIERVVPKKYQIKNLSILEETSCMNGVNSENA